MHRIQEMSEIEKQRFPFRCLQCHLEEIARLTKSRSEAVEEVRREMEEMKVMGVEMIQSLQQQVVSLEGESKQRRTTTVIELCCKL